jgi:hypothetical protein
MTSEQDKANPPPRDNFNTARTEETTNTCAREGRAEARPAHKSIRQSLYEARRPQAERGMRESRRNTHQHKTMEHIVGV